MISIKEARKILGKASENMSDEEILHVIETLHLMARDALSKNNDTEKSSS